METNKLIGNVNNTEPVAKGMDKSSSHSHDRQPLLPQHVLSTPTFLFLQEGQRSHQDRECSAYLKNLVNPVGEFHSSGEQTFLAAGRSFVLGSGFTQA